MAAYQVKLHYGAYEHSEWVNGAEDEQQAIAKAWKQAERKGLLTLSMAATSATATEAEDDSEEDG